MNNNIRTNKKIVRLTESDLRKIVRESIKTTLNEMAYGTDFDDTLKWVQRKKPNISPSSQERFARNIMNKYKREHGDEMPKNQRDVKPKMPYKLDGYYVDGQTTLDDGRILTVVSMNNIRLRYGGVVRFGIYIDNQYQGCFVNYEPALIERGIYEYVDDIKRAVPHLAHLLETEPMHIVDQIYQSGAYDD